MFQSTANCVLYSCGNGNLRPTCSPLWVICTHVTRQVSLAPLVTKASLDQQSQWSTALARSMSPPLGQRLRDNQTWSTCSHQNTNYRCTQMLINGGGFVFTCDRGKVAVCFYSPRPHWPGNPLSHRKPTKPSLILLSISVKMFLRYVCVENWKYSIAGHGWPAYCWCCLQVLVAIRQLNLLHLHP